MPTDAEIEAKFWNALQSDRIVMLGLASGERGHARPMAAQIEDAARGPIWFFTSTESDLVQELGQGAAAAVQFADKGHDVFASLTGQLTPDNDRSTINRLWNPYAAAWYEDGKDDPKLALIRFDPDQAEIWLDENSMFAGVKAMLGVDPKEDYKDTVANVDMG